MSEKISQITFPRVATIRFIEFSSGKEMLNIQVGLQIQL